MPSYKAPIDDLKFVLNDYLHVTDYAGQLPGFDMVDQDVIDDVLNGAAKVCEEVLAPVNLAGDAEGARLENGVVRAPSVFHDAYKAYCEGGWNAVGSPPEYGGMGLPQVLSMAVTEMTVSSNHALSMYFGLTGAAAGAVMGGAPPEMKEIYAPKMVSGEWCGTMNLTEPHCGTDLKLMKTKAVPQDDGTYRITGTKIFISGGDHDMVDNIIHMVIAKVPDEDGKLADDLSTVNFFLVPKILVNEDGSLGEANGVTCGAVEKKMGIKGSATCVLNFDNAVAYKMGGSNQAKAANENADKKDKKSSSEGMAGMFNMMNVARMGVGLQGYAVAEAAYQNAAIYTKERIQGRSLTGPKNPDGPADPIIVHPDVRRMLMTCKSFTEGARALTMWVALQFSKARGSDNPEEAKAALDVAMLMTPVIKAFFTDMGCETSNMAMQCFGGHGYIHETGVEQFVRDARILPIYEGANGVQALDLVGRKLPAGGGRAIGHYFNMINGFIDDNKDNADMADYVAPLQKGMGNLTEATGWLMENAAANRDHAGGVSAEYLRIFGIVTLGWIWADMAKTALGKLAEGAGDKEAFYKAKQLTAKFWMERMLPDTAALLTKVKYGSDTMMAMDEEMFG